MKEQFSKTRFTELPQELDDDIYDQDEVPNEIEIFCSDGTTDADSHLFRKGTIFADQIKKNKGKLILDKFSRWGVNNYIYFLRHSDFHASDEFFEIHKANGFKSDYNYSNAFLELKILEDRDKKEFYDKKRKPFSYLYKTGNLEVNHDAIKQVCIFLPKFAYIAGGSLVAELNNRSDIDIFFAGCDEKEAKKSIERFVQAMRFNKTIDDKRVNYELEMINIQQKCTTLNFRLEEGEDVKYKENKRIYSRLNIQFIHRIYSIPDEILLGFDVDSCCFLFDGKDVWTTIRGAYAKKWKLNHFDGEKASPSYPYRLLKYKNRGFTPVFPNLDLSKIDKDKLLSKIYGFDVKLSDFKNEAEIKQDLIYFCSSRPWSKVFQDQEHDYKSLYRQSAQVLVFVSLLWNVYPEKGVVLASLSNDYIFHNSKEKEGEKQLIFHERVTGELPDYIKTNQKGDMIVSIAQYTDLFENIKWVTQDPMKQLTGSFNLKTIDDVTNWYRESGVYN